MERAEVVMDKTEKKVERSKGREKVGKERGKQWEVVNGGVGKVMGKKEEEEWEDESSAEDGREERNRFGDEDMVDVGSEEAGEKTGGEVENVKGRVEEEDEIL
jgi:hypothetical protein